MNSIQSGILGSNLPLDPGRQALLGKIADAKNQIEMLNNKIRDLEKALTHFPDPCNQQVPYSFQCGQTGPV